MKIAAARAALLRTALRGRSRPELKRLFATIRAHDDHVLLSALAASPKRAAKQRPDALLRDLQRILKPIMGRASEKADLLVEHIAAKHRCKLALEPAGLADAARQLRATFSDDQIRSAAESLMAHLAKLHGRETVT